MRSFVFVSDIPDFLLEPLPDGARVARNRDPRFERLRGLLASLTSGLMLVMHLENRGFALALYASESEALDACKARIVPEQPGHTHAPLRLRILERERPPPPEAVFKPTLTVEGTEIEKSALAMTRGLELVYSGRAVARWCPHTAAGEDCLFGTACYRLHRRDVQRTVQKRPRMESFSSPAHTRAVQAREKSDDLSPQDELMTSAALAAVQAIVQSTRRVEERLVPPEMRVAHSVHIPITCDEAQYLVDGKDSDSDCFHKLVARVSGALPAELRDVPLFAKFGFPGGAPWDWSLHDAAVGIPALARRAPFPASGTETPLTRDLYAQQLLFHINAMNCFTDTADALRAFAASPKVRAALAAHIAQSATTTTATTATTTATTATTTTEVELCVRPWISLPTAGAETRALFEESGGRVRGIAQRHSALRLMTSAKMIARGEWSRYAIIGSGGDAEAEAALEEELRESRGALRHAVESIRAHMRQRVARGELPRGGMFCLQIARTKEGAVVLSAKPYRDALEECVVLGADKGAEPWWSLNRHAYVPLFSREIIERLRVESAKADAQEKE